MIKLQKSLKIKYRNSYEFSVLILHKDPTLFERGGVFIVLVKSFNLITLLLMQHSFLLCRNYSW